MPITRYPSDLTDTEWKILHPLLPPRRKRRRPPTDRRRVLDAIRYVLRSSCAWRMLPREFGPWSTSYDIYRCWVKTGLWKKLHDRLRDKVRRADGRAPQPTAAVLDSQSVKVGDRGGPSGYDAGKKVTGRKRHILLDTLGLLLGVYVGPANEQDRDGAKTLLARILGWYQRGWSKSGPTAAARALVAWVKARRPRGQLHLDIVRRRDDARGFEILPKRCLVERTFAWLFKQRRLARDYERNLEHSEAWLYIAMSGLMLRRLARPRQK